MKLLIFLLISVPFICTLQNKHISSKHTPKNNHGLMEDDGMDVVSTDTGSDDAWDATAGEIAGC